MKKAAAFITDEGGITSHAAIIARELRSTIIGTKIATKVLHDGDEVEINADENIVNIIRKSHRIKIRNQKPRGYSRPLLRADKIQKQISLGFAKIKIPRK